MVVQALTIIQPVVENKITRQAQHSALSPTRKKSTHTTFKYGTTVAGKNVKAKISYPTQNHFIQIAEILPYKVSSFSDAKTF